MIIIVSASQLRLKNISLCSLIFDVVRQHSDTGYGRFSMTVLSILRPAARNRAAFTKQPAPAPYYLRTPIPISLLF